MLSTAASTCCWYVRIISQQPKQQYGTPQPRRHEKSLKLALRFRAPLAICAALLFVRVLGTQSNRWLPPHRAMSTQRAVHICLQKQLPTSTLHCCGSMALPIDGSYIPWERRLLRYNKAYYETRVQHISTFQ